MDRASWVPPTLNGEGAASCETTPSEMRLATQHEDTSTGPGLQPTTEARRCEINARQHGLAALRLCGALALQHAALGTHYARRSMALMRGARL